MVAIVSGNSLGLNLTSLGVLGGKGVLGDAAQGRAGEAGYVNIANGNLVLQDQDDRLVGRGGGVAAVRTYNSQGLMTDDNGDNWSLGTFLQQIRLSGTVNTAGSVLTRTERDGSQATYSWDAAKARYVSTAGGGAYDTITHDAANARYIWTDGESRRVEHYESAATGRLLQVIDPAGNAVTYSYNANNTLASMLTATGEATHFDYSGTNVSQIRVVVGGVTQTRTRYAYDASNRLVSVTVDLSPADNSVADGKRYVTTYSYDGSSKRIASAVQTDGSSLAFTYVQVGTEHRVASVTDAQGRITRYSYDTANRRTTVTDPLGLSTVYAYDAAGQLLQITYPAVGGAGGAGGVSQTVGFAYNAAGDVISVTDGQARAPLAGEGIMSEARMNRLVQTKAQLKALAQALEAEGKNEEASAAYWQLADFPSVINNVSPDGTVHMGYSAGGKGPEKEALQLKAIALNTWIPSLQTDKRMMAKGFPRYDIRTQEHGRAYLAAWREIADALGEDGILPGDYRTAIYQVIRWTSPPEACAFIQRAYRFEPFLMPTKDWWARVDSVRALGARLGAPAQPCVIDGLPPL